MCICTITPQQMELDLAHTLKHPTSTPTTAFTPTLDDFKETVDTVLMESSWFSDMVASRVDAELGSLVDDEVDRRLERFFERFDVHEHVDFGDLVDTAIENIDFEYKIEQLLDNNFDPEDYVKEAVSDYMSHSVDVEVIANEEVHEILTDTDFINALALAIINTRKAQAAERKAKREHLFQTGQYLGEVQTTTQGENHASL
jgi:hypothetical protein